MKSRRISPTRALWALILFTVQLLAWNAQSFCTRTYTTASSNRRRASVRTSLLLLHESDDNNNNSKDDTNKKDKNDDDESYSWAELQADEKLRQMEYNSSIKRKNAMLLPQRISRAIYTLGWTFVISGILLNSLGFAWISKPGGIGIGTLDQRDFQRELYRRVEDTKDDDAKNNIISRAYYNDVGEGYVKKWVLSMKDEQRTC